MKQKSQRVESLYWSVFALGALLTTALLVRTASIFPEFAPEMSGVVAYNQNSERVAQLSTAASLPDISPDSYEFRIRYHTPTVEKVVFAIGADVHEDSTSPFTYTPGIDLEEGEYTLVAIPYDVNGVIKAGSPIVLPFSVE